MRQPTRRVVTAQEGQLGTIVSDDPVAPLDLGSGMEVVELWRAGEGGRATSLDSSWSLEPPASGHVLRIARFPPALPGEVPWMHRTSTTDYAIVLEGEMTLVTDEGETVMRLGDVVIQQGANHGWINRSMSPCRIAVVLIDTALPKP